MGGMPGMSEDEIKMALEYRDKMTRTLADLRFEAESGGITVRITSQSSRVQMLRIS